MSFASQWVWLDRRKLLDIHLFLFTPKLRISVWDFAKSQLFRFGFWRTSPLVRVYANGARSRQNRSRTPVNNQNGRGVWAC